MKKIFLKIILVLVFTGSGASGVFAADLNGHDWVKWDAGRKNSFVQGFLTGSNYVIWKNLKKPAVYDEQEGQKALRKYLLARAAGVHVRFKAGEVTFLRDMAVLRAVNETNETLLKYVVYNSFSNKLSSGLDEFFSDPKKRGIKIADAVFITKIKLAGASQEEINGMLSSLVYPGGDARPVKRATRYRPITFP
ncbi:MAG: hypothetical protein BMS9Abin23_1126 [Thermodesulfobacteriota bacterium]|nr:MAG: hypothetical protein BMS9Abin23_1126 [Thermodesulfobacteriota bacterium]